MSLCQMWVTPEDLCCEKGKFKNIEIQDAIRAASETLSWISYHRFGICEYKISPCNNTCSQPCRKTGCSGKTIIVQIPGGRHLISVDKIEVWDAEGDKTEPSVAPIWIEGQTIHFPEDWEFPQQYAAKPGSPKTWQITVSAGREIPALGKLAAIELANKFLSDGKCKTECSVPDDITTMSRDGAEYRIIASLSKYARLKKVAFFIENYGKRKRWTGAVSPLNETSQLVQ